MFGIHKWILIILFAGATLSLGLWYYRDTQDRIQVMTETIARIKAAAEEQTRAMDSISRDIELITESRRRIDEEFKQASDRVKRLEEKLSEHELDYLARNRPVLVERTINRATQDVNRCLEIMSGSPLTLAEIEATLPSQINTSCPELANPNYIPDNR